MKESQLSVLIFDSGVGGLSVYRGIRKLFPRLHYIYTFDNDAFPYGEKSGEFVIDRVFRLIKKVQKKNALAIAIIACNTASIVSLPILRLHFPFPVLGVVPPIKEAIKFTKNGVIGLIATKATIGGSYTRSLINEFAIGLKVEMIASSELVRLAEKKIYGQLILKEKLIRIIEPWLKMKTPPDTIVLGCTHFSLLISELQEILFRSRLIDSTSELIKQVVCLINGNDLMLTKRNNVAYCTRIDSEIERVLIPILTNEGFGQLEKISI